MLLQVLARSSISDIWLLRVRLILRCLGSAALSAQALLGSLVVVNPDILLLSGEEVCVSRSLIVGCVKLAEGLVDRLVAHVGQHLRKHGFRLIERLVLVLLLWCLQVAQRGMV